jgi:hypothetical protein
MPTGTFDEEHGAPADRVDQRTADDEPGLEGAPPFDPVRGRAAEHQQAREHERIRVDRPLELRQRRVQRSVDRRQRDVHDRRVEAHDQEAHRADAEDQQSLSAIGPVLIH